MARVIDVASIRVVGMDKANIKDAFFSQASVEVKILRLAFAGTRSLRLAFTQVVVPKPVFVRHSFQKLKFVEDILEFVEEIILEHTSVKVVGH